MLLNSLLSFSAIPGAIIAWRQAEPAVSGFHSAKNSCILRALIALSCLFSVVYHASERAVRGHGLPGVIATPFWFEHSVLMLDRIFAVFLTSFVLSIFRSTTALKEAIRKQAIVLSVGAGAGIFSELPFISPWLYVVLHSVWHVSAYISVSEALVHSRVAAADE